MSSVDHTQFLHLSDAELLRQCQLDTIRGTGPGGQKRNKTESAVRLRHQVSGLSTKNDETRSQHQNRARALARLRWIIAVTLRRPLDLATYRVPPALGELCRHALGRRSPAYLPAVALLLDLFVATGCSVSQTATHLGLTSAATSRLLLADDDLARAVNTLRAEHDLRPLR